MVSWVVCGLLVRGYRESERKRKRKEGANFVDLCV